MFTMSKNFYSQNHLTELNQLKHMTPDQLHAYSEFSSTVLKEGTLSRKEKVIIAVAIAHAKNDPYSIYIHTRTAKAEEVSLEELAEAVFVASALEAGGAVAHSSHMQDAFDTNAPQAFYDRSNGKKLQNLNEWVPEGYKAYSDFSSAVMKAGKVSAKLKEIIAVSVAHVTECPYCIDAHTKKAEKNGATKKELSEAILVTSAVLAGGAYAHMVNLIQSYEEEK
jgi:AhpD family alkylhydroperoxidase